MSPTLIFGGGIDSDLSAAWTAGITNPASTSSTSNLFMNCLLFEMKPVSSLSHQAPPLALRPPSRICELRLSHLSTFGIMLREYAKWLIAETFHAAVQ